MRFYDVLNDISFEQVEKKLAEVQEKDVKNSMGSSHLNSDDFLNLLSPMAEQSIEQMAQRANSLSIAQFGRVMGLYTPMYLSNYCSNQCIYCGFNKVNDIPRKQLRLEEVEKEAAAIAKTGLKHILILTGEAPNIATISYLQSCCNILKRYFNSITIEIYPLKTKEYGALIRSGVDGLTIYQETYNSDLYARLHPKGPKRDFLFRLNAPERGCVAGMRNVSIGSLLGLEKNWRTEVFITGLHAAFLMKRFPGVDISISLPRMRPHEGEFQPACNVSDRNMVQIITALRIFLPRCGINISTREHPDFRENIIPLGVTKMSAGVSTSVGGHSQESQEGNNVGQFDISDERSVVQVSEMLKQRGYQPVYKDWDIL